MSIGSQEAITLNGEVVDGMMGELNGTHVTLISESCFNGHHHAASVGLNGHEHHGAGGMGTPINMHHWRTTTNSPSSTSSALLTPGSYRHERIPLTCERGWPIPEETARIVYKGDVV